MTEVSVSGLEGDDLENVGCLLERLAKSFFGGVRRREARTWDDSERTLSLSS